MAQNPIAALDEAIAGLEEVLAGDPNFILLRQLKLARAGYPGSPKREAASEADDAEGARAKPRRRMDPKREMALKLTAEFLEGKSEPVRTKVISADLREKGCVLNGNHENNLASLLLRSDRFVSHGRAGWTLTGSAFDVDESENSPEAADGNLLPGITSAASFSSPGMTNGGTQTGTA